MSEQKHESCAGCRYDLGGGRDNCTLCVAAECRDGGGFEAYKAIPENIAEAVSSVMHKSLTMSKSDSRYERVRDEILTEIEKIAGEEYRERFFEIARADKHKYGITTELAHLFNAKKALLRGVSPEDVLMNMELLIAMEALEVICVN